MMKKTVAILTSVTLLVALAIHFKKSPNIADDASDRSPAAAFDSAKQQAVVDQITGIVLGVKSRTDIPVALKQINDIVAKPETKGFPAVQMMGAVASLIPSFEGIIWRCRAFIEPSDYLHMTVLYKLRGIAYNDYLYGPHIRALFDYATYPSIAQGPAFARVYDLQNFLHDNIGSKLSAVLTNATAMEVMSSHSFAFNFDRTLLVGTGDDIRFIDPDDAKKKFTKTDFFTLEFLLQRTLMTIDYLSALDLDELPQVGNGVLKETTINKLNGAMRALGDTAKGITPQMIYTVINRTKDFLNFRPDAQPKLDDAFKYGRLSAKYELAAYVCGITYPVSEQSKGAAPKVDIDHCLSLPDTYSKDLYVKNGDDYLYDPNHLLENFKHKFHALRDRYQVYESSASQGFATVTSDVTGKSITVNVKALFMAENSPRKFLPTGYVPNVSTSQKLADGSSSVAWNYDYGKPTTYPDYTFGGFFGPDESHDTASLYKSMTSVLYTDSIADFAVFLHVPSSDHFFISPREIVKEN